MLCLPWRRFRADTFSKSPYILPALLTILAAVLFGLQFRQRIGVEIWHFVDFRAFYCSGSVAAMHADPYRAEPLGTCERTMVPNRELAASGFVVPAPAPGWAIFAFEPVARLPFVAAATLWWCAIVVTFYVLQIQCARLFPSIPKVTIWALLFLLGLDVPILLGQIAPICIVLLLASALLLRTGKVGSAAVIATLASIEPHIAIPVCMALFCAERRTRVPMLACAAVLTILSVSALGAAENVEYVQRVLPIHVASESHYPDQYSATFLAMAFGIGQRAAIDLGQLSYWMLAIAGCVLARTYRVRGGSLELAVVVPMAFSVVGGPFVHAHHLLAAVPLAFSVVDKNRRAWWPLLLAVSVAWPLRVVLQLCGAVHVGGITLPGKSFASRGVLAEVPWRVTLEGSHATMFDTFAKVPTWVGLIVLVAIAALRSRPLVRLSASFSEDLPPTMDATRGLFIGDRP